MAYASVAQAEHSPHIPEISNPSLSPGFGFDFGRHGESSDETQGRPRVSSILNSLSSNHSYEMVEDDDYEEPMRTPVGLALNIGAPTTYSPPQDAAFQSPDPPMRTASISRNLPLNHPTPDLHTLQGALVKNVERLEESAERLSMTSSLEDELHKMRLDQKRIERQSSAPATLDHVLKAIPQRQFSTGSWSNSILGVNQAARTGGYSPSGYITSPTGSIHSNPWSGPHPPSRHSSKGSRRDPSQPEPLLEGRPLEFTSPPRSAVTVYNQGVPVSSAAVEDTAELDRPATSASNDTFQQAEAAFNDFDGVHYGTNLSLDRGDPTARRISLRQPPLARDSKAYREAQPGEKMIYYPAPVPVMLNLPQRLSKANFGEKEKRRLQGLSGVPDELRKSAPWLMDQDPSKLHAFKQSLNLPPQLRASAFFEHPSITQNLQLKNGSAIQTLDSILDAAAYAPVSAFTDHPIAGHLGKEVYGSAGSARKSMQLQDDTAKKRKSSLSTMLKTKRSMSGSRLGLTKSRDSKDLLDADDHASGDELDKAAAASIAPDDDEVPEDAVHDEDDEDDQPQGFSAAPTTLLAELQMRKEQQKLRTRTAADAYPNGMHSTLLELDAVTQLQQKARKTKHVTLAWEDHDEASKQNFADDDVPLGVLFPEKDGKTHFNIHKPVGLLERREMEDNEPLSQRRARLRGESLPSARSEVKSQIDESDRAPVIEEIPGMSQNIAEEEDETLAQRAARMKREKERGTGGQFADELTSELGLNVNKVPVPSKTPDAEETLGQRRKRLQKEALENGTAANNSRLKSMHSLADVLQAHPVGLQQRQISYESKGPTLQRAQTQGPLLSSHAGGTLNNFQGTNWASARQNSVFLNGNSGNFYQQNSPYMNATYNASTPAMYGAPMPMYMQHQMGGYGYMQGYGNQPYVQDPMSGPPLDPKQRQKIDQWRQSIAP